MQRATDMIRKWSRLIGEAFSVLLTARSKLRHDFQCEICIWLLRAGLVQRFSLGFRGPLCLVCGFTGVSARQFGAGAALGALGTMPLQLFAVRVLGLNAAHASTQSHAPVPKLTGT